MRITMIGHSTVLIETGGKKILTDPYWGTFGNPAFARIGIPARSRQEMSQVDAVLVSHDHWDHVDAEYFHLLGEVPVFTNMLASKSIRLMGGRNISVMKVGQSVSLGEVTLTAVPAVHLTLTIGFVLQAEDKTIYFAGDTFYRPFMLELGQKYKLDAALMPVTTFRLPMTMGEQGALKALHALHPAVVIPIHLGIQPRLPLMRTGQTPEHFAARMKEDGSASKLVILREGESYME